MFLLENPEGRRKYDAKRASEQMRRQADAARERGMSERRKRLRVDLKRKEEEALRAGKSVKETRHRKRMDDNVEKLRRQGAEMREAYADREAEKAVRKDSERQSQQKRLLEDRQVRLKWSRKKMRGKMSPSEHSIAELMAQFGDVERVEMLGSKGNAVLVTFASHESCRPCVKFYAESDEMRASFVGRKLEKEQAGEQERAEAKVRSRREGRDREDVGDWKLRRAAERERILREMERQEDGGPEDGGYTPAPTKRKRTGPFPPSFPDSNEYKHLSPLEKLEKAEGSILKDVLSAEALQRMRVAR